VHQESSCIFCKIVRREIPAKVLHETPLTLAFADLNPMAPTHVLVIPKRHLSGLSAAKSSDADLLGAVLSSAREVAEELGLAASGYRTVINDGADAGQSVGHLHAHVLGGRPLSWPPG
jgi:histidine triad (HIT) family protein